MTGWYLGREVNSRFSRTDGCEIARWRAMAPLLGGNAGGHRRHLTRQAGGRAPKPPGSDASPRCSC